MISKKLFSDIKNSFFYIKKSSLIFDIAIFFYIRNSFFLYQEFEYVISKFIFWCHKFFFWYADFFLYEELQLLISNILLRRLVNMIFWNNILVVLVTRSIFCLLEKLHRSVFMLLGSKENLPFCKKTFKSEIINFLPIEIKVKIVRNDYWHATSSRRKPFLFSVL